VTQQSDAYTRTDPSWGGEGNTGPMSESDVYDCLITELLGQTSRVTLLTLPHTHTRLMAFWPRLPRWASTRNQSGFYWSTRQWVAVASAGLLPQSLVDYQSSPVGRYSQDDRVRSTTGMSVLTGWSMSSPATARFIKSHCCALSEFTASSVVTGSVSLSAAA